eukprot:733627_1
MATHSQHYLCLAIEVVVINGMQISMDILLSYPPNIKCKYSLEQRRQEKGNGCMIHLLALENVCLCTYPPSHDHIHHYIIQVYYAMRCEELNCKMMTLHPMHFVAVPAAKVPPRNSDIKRLLAGKRGIKSFHCVKADVDGDLYFRDYSCFCKTCMASSFRKCDKCMFVGEWVKVNKIQKKSDAPPKSREKVLYNEDGYKWLFGEKNANKWTVPQLKQLCKNKQLNLKGITRKNDVIRALLELKKESNV